MRARTRTVHAFSLSALLAASHGCYDTKLIEPDARGGAAGGSGGGDGGSAGDTKSMGGSKAGVSGADGSGGVTTGGQAAASGGNSARITWLEFDGSNTLNAELGIQGTAFAYSDDCAKWSYDATNRCLSGKSCEPGGSNNWGVSLGFYFRDSGPSGTPPNTVSTWNPEDYGVKGLAWRVSGSAPGLQLWVLNMDPVFDGQCSSATCEIVGPPDGTPSPEKSGELFFDALTKDYWSGTGVKYQFSPAAVHALQFKLPAVIVGAASFSFCLDQLGVVR